MRFAYSTNAFRAYPIEKALETVAELGFDGVEISADVPHIWLWQEKGILRRLKRKLDQLNLSVSNINAFTMFWCGDMQNPSWLTPYENLARLRIKHTEWALYVASELGAPSVSTQPGGPIPSGLSREEALNLFIKRLKQVAPTARKLGIMLLVEPEPALLLESEDDFLWFYEKAETLKDVCGMNFDAGHMVCAGRDPAVAFLKVAHLVRHIHIEDIKNRKHIHLIPGEGEIDFSSFFGVLRRVGYEGFVSLELYTYQHKPEEAGRRGLVYLREVAGNC